LLVADATADAFVPGDHGSTFGGNPVSCAAACAVVDAVVDALLENVRSQGARLSAGLRALTAVEEVRGRGLLLGAVVGNDAGDVVEACRAAGLLVLTAGDDVVRLAPPLTVTATEVSEALELLAGVLGT
jgi:acetylornithine/succinyldiaminopimelate/putrescine aminotransferase